MATRIRLQRHGKKGNPFFHLVAADSRAKRDGKFIEKLGIYNPTANPAFIDINFENTLAWVQKGAEMSDTARAILSYKGVLFKNHLLNGVRKGALTLDQVEEKFTKWLSEKEAKIQGKKDGLAKNAKAEKIAKLKAEQDSNAAKALSIAEKNAPRAEATDEIVVEITEDSSVDITEVVAQEELVADDLVAETPTLEESTESSAEVVEELNAEEVVAESVEEAQAPTAELSEDVSIAEAPNVYQETEETTESASEVAEEPSSEETDAEGQTEEPSSEA
ncbi:MAG: 30S ribosomal protein S16 [Bacteroidetes bacterium]|nr:30S ribosomal protein S16 [Bacteroidota bacterium]